MPTPGSNTNGGITYYYEAEGDVITLTNIEISDTALSTATLPNNITLLKSDLASGIPNCSGITHLIIGSNVTTFGNSMFNGWTGLTSVTINSRVISTFLYDAFNENKQNTTYSGPLINSFTNSPITTVSLYPETEVYSLFIWLFENTNTFRNIIILEGSTFIAPYCFQTIKYLTQVTIPNSITNISNGAFSQCNSLRSFSLPGSTTTPRATLGMNSFKLDDNYAVNINSDIVNNFINQGYSSTKLLYAGFYINDFFYLITNGVMTNLTCSNFIKNGNGKQLLIVNTVTSNGQLMVQGNAIQNKVLSIAFEPPSIFTTWNANSGLAGSAYLTSITFPDSLTIIGLNSFANCTSLTSVVLPNLNRPGLPNLVMGAGAFSGTAVSQASLQAMLTQGYEPNTLRNAGFANVPDNAVTPVPCFNEDSKILCLVDGEEKELLVQNIRNGVLVKTLHAGYKPVCMIGTSVICNPGTDERFKDRLFICKKEKYPELNQDLIITGCHSILVDSITDEQRAQTMIQMKDIYVTEGKYRLNANLDDRAQPYNCAGNFNIYHIALEHENYYKNYGVYANGLLVETCSKRYLKELSNMTLL